MSGARLAIEVSGRPLALEYRWTGADAAGDAPVMVFLHEGLGSIAMWRDFPERLCLRLGVRGLVYSRYGYGRSTPRGAGDKLPRSYLHREAQDILPQVLKALGIESAFLFGHSDGGSIALIAAASDPGLFPAIVVLAPHINVEDVAIRNIQATRVAYHERGLREKLARYHDDVDSAFYGWSGAWLDPSFRDWNIEAELENIRCPVLAIQGVDDEYATLEQIRGIRRRAPQTQLLELPDCGHSPHRDQCEAVIAAVQEFLSIRQAGES
jgi:pimeloyl-ACP methyl ester carboxylesterase